MEKTPKQRRRSFAHQNRPMEISLAKINRALLGTFRIQSGCRGIPNP